MEGWIFLVVNLKAKKRLVSRVTGKGIHRIYFNPEYLDDVTDAISRTDIRSLITANIITIKKKKGTSRGRAQHKILQKKKRGAKPGSKQGKKGARVGKKQAYVKKIRSLRYALKVVKDRKEITNKDFWLLYKKIGGNIVRNKAHLRTLIQEVKQNQKT